MVIISSITYSGNIEKEKLNLDFPAIANNILKQNNHHFVSDLFIDGNERNGTIDLAIMNVEDASEIPDDIRKLLKEALENFILN